MKKTSTKLQLSTTTVRVLQDGALVAVRGGGGTGGSSNHPLACAGAATYCCPAGGAKL